MSAPVSKSATGAWAVLLILSVISIISLAGSLLFGASSHSFIRLLQGLGHFLSHGFRLTYWFIPLYFLWGIALLFFPVSYRHIFIWAAMPLPFFTISACMFLLLVPAAEQGALFSTLVYFLGEGGTLFVLGISVLFEGIGILLCARRFSSKVWLASHKQEEIGLKEVQAAEPKVMNEGAESEISESALSDASSQALLYGDMLEFDSLQDDLTDVQKKLNMQDGDEIFLLDAKFDMTSVQNEISEDDSIAEEEISSLHIADSFPKDDLKDEAFHSLAVEPEHRENEATKSSEDTLSHEGAHLDPDEKIPRPKETLGYAIPAKAVQHSEAMESKEEIEEEIKKSSVLLETTLQEFGIKADVIAVRRGPSITMFEVLPAPGIKLTRISNLSDNIALRLAAENIRIVAPIPGKEAVGIEIPNKRRRLVRFGNLISSAEYQNERIKIPVVLGEDITGSVQITDLTMLPHLLLAGATGSGKSVCVNSIICSLLYKCSPREVKLIMIDPKIVELNFYNDIPHLLTPVVTKPSRAFQVLQYCICEMEHRYNQLEGMGVRDITSYNQKSDPAHRLPYIVVIIDEFADLMLNSGKDLESTVSRLTAMSRAVGIHLVLATQRPSTDVITGLIKANIPSRIAFMVASKVDSRIILDTSGAEKLLGRGDMLFCSPWDPHPTRIQGAFLSEAEVEAVVSEVKKFAAPEYIDDEIFIEEEREFDVQGTDDDPLLAHAIDIVSGLKRTSTSFLQRKLKIGYNRAARLIEHMEHLGIVGPQNGSKPRTVLSASGE